MTMKCTQKQVFDSTLCVSRQHTRFERTFDSSGIVDYRPSATRQQPRNGKVDDENAHQELHPDCCGLGHLLALQTTPHLAPEHRRQQGRTNASNGA